MAASHALLRPALFATRLLQWCSAVIVMGLVSWFIKQSNTGEHYKYEETIATISVAFFFVPLCMTFLKRFTWHFMPLDVIFSYLWLTSFIFTAQDYSWHAPPAEVDGSKKYTVEAFTFLAFFFTLVAAVLQGAIWLAEREPAGGLPVHEKPRPSAETGTTV